MRTPYRKPPVANQMRRTEARPILSAYLKQNHVKPLMPMGVSSIKRLDGEPGPSAESTYPNAPGLLPVNRPKSNVKFAGERWMNQHGSSAGTSKDKNRQRTEPSTRIPWWDFTHPGSEVSFVGGLIRDAWRAHRDMMDPDYVYPSGEHVPWAETEVYNYVGPHPHTGPSPTEVSTGRAPNMSSAMGGQLPSMPNAPWMNRATRIKR